MRCVVEAEDARRKMLKLVRTFVSTNDFIGYVISLAEFIVRVPEQNPAPNHNNSNESLQLALKNLAGVFKPLFECCRTFPGSVKTYGKVKLARYGV